MIGISVAAKREWQEVLKKYNIDINECEKYPFGEYFIAELNGEKVVFYRSGVRKMLSSAAAQYMIIKFSLNRIIVVGTCAGIDERYNPLDIFIPNKAVQYDCTVKEQEPLIKDSFTIEFDLEGFLLDVNTGVIGTADKAVVMKDDFFELQENGITIADTESAAVAYVCQANNVSCTIIKGISDFPVNGKNNDSQLNDFINNTPIIMNKILGDYLPQLIKMEIKYKNNSNLIK